MRRLVLIAALCAPGFAGVANADAGAEHVVVHTERPPEGSLRRGLLAVPGWTLYVGGAALALAAGGVLVWRLARSRRR
ncbi:MAG: hypothetical protein KF729_38795 [Sandaracinaceae bacterium]|nr:hypothetical protein [Sandaracinaceae bacterium]